MGNKKQKKIQREYYILSGIEGMKEKLVEAELELSPAYFMIVNADSGIGKLIEEEAKRRVNKPSLNK